MIRSYRDADVLDESYSPVKERMREGSLQKNGNI